MTDFLTIMDQQAQALLQKRGQLKFWQSNALEVFQSMQPMPIIRLLILDLLDSALIGKACIDLSHWLLLFLKPLNIGPDKTAEIENSLLMWILEEPCLKYERPWIYLKSYWDLEERIAKRLHYFSNLKNELLFSDLKDDSFLQKLNLEQKQAVFASLRTPFLIVAGGPGTGKTFTAASICEGLKQALIHKKNSLSSIRIALLAPTGKAAIRLYESITLASKSSSNAVVESMTIHAYLAKGMKEGGYHFISNPAPYDIILVDEASMIDAVHFDELFKTVHASTHLILMGDPDQLPPVEGPGLFLSMVIASSIQKENQALNCVRLKKPVRAQNQTLVQCAQSIRQGDERAWKELIKNNQEVKGHLIEQEYEISSDFFKTFAENAMKSQLNEILQPSLNQAKVLAFQPVEKIIHALWEEMLLCVSRTGSWGTQSINQKLFQKIRLAALQERWPYLNIPVMATVNQPALERMNGQMGLIRVYLNELEYLHTLEAALSKAKEVYFQTSSDEFITIPCIRLEKMQPAWAITVHKSQGSEFDSVQLLLTEKALLFGRTLLYTACTRAKKHLDVWSYASVLSDLFKSETTDLTGMTQRLLRFQQLKPEN